MISCACPPPTLLRLLQLIRSSVFGEARRLLDVWSEFSGSPIITQFGWSPLIELAFDTNREAISPATSLEPPLYTVPFTSNRERYTRLPGLLALHIRRGDFEAHCQLLAHHNSSFTAYNAFADLPDRLDTPLSGDEEERISAYRPHCFPDISEIVAKADEVRESDAGKGLRRVFVMTNGDAKWVEGLKRALAKSGWEAVASSRDVVVNKEQKYVEQAVDMLIGQRAQVFVGNGVSISFRSLRVRRDADARGIVFELDGTDSHAQDGERIPDGLESILLTRTAHAHVPYIPLSVIFGT